MASVSETVSASVLASMRARGRVSDCTDAAALEAALQEHLTVYCGLTRRPQACTWARWQRSWSYGAFKWLDIDQLSLWAGQLDSLETQNSQGNGCSIAGTKYAPGWTR